MNGSITTIQYAVKSYEREITMGGDSQVPKEQQAHKCATKSHIQNFQKKLGNARKVMKTLCNLWESATFVAESIKSSSQTADSPTEL